VSASNADGKSAAFSKPTAVISDNQAPTNTARPTVAGTPQPGEELTASNGTWTGGVATFAYQWQRCDASGTSCVDVTGATGRVYGVRAADVGHTIRVVVTAKNGHGSTTVNSGTTAVVRTAASPTPAPAPAPAPAQAANHKPSIRILSVRFAGARVFVRFRTCDDSRRNLSILQRDSKPGARAYRRSFRTLVAPRNCSTLTRSWILAPRFRHGRYTVTLTARDAFRLTSLPARRTFFR
jgi:hypothetical protein